MKHIHLLFFLLSFFSQYRTFGKEPKLTNKELENFILITDQELYLAGDRVWFAAKLLKNHESYRYSKLAYLAVLDASGKPIHQEKMLLTGQDMIFGDLFIPENSSSGVFSLVVYTKWMANFGDFPIAKKDFLVANPNSPIPDGQPALFWEQVPFENSLISIFHTSNKSEVIEIQDLSGKTLEVMESVAPMTKTLSKVKPTDSYQLVFRNKVFQIQPAKWNWDPSDFSLKPHSSLRGEEFKIVSHTDWMVLEEIQSKGEKSFLTKTAYQDLGNFKISILDQSDRLVWTYQVQLSSKPQGQLQINSKGKTGEELKLDLTGFSNPVKTGIVLASEEEDPAIVEFVEILNHPNWKNLNERSASPNLISALGNEAESPLLLKDYSPMFDYMVWSTDIHSRFLSSTQSLAFSYVVSEDLIESLIDRRVYRDHFEIPEEVVALQSPFAADKVYNLQDYEEFPDMESLIKEIVPQVRLRKSSNGTGKEIFIANTDNQNVKFNKKPLILIDFYRTKSLDEVWNLDPVTVDRIELYYHRSTVEATNLGESAGDGFLVIYTKNNEYFLKNNLPKDRYFLADVSVPRRPDYLQKNSQRISANPLQFLDSGLTFYRGKSKSGNLVFDTAGKWQVEAWVFGNSAYWKLNRELVIE